MTGTFLDYLPPTATELPRVVSAHLESPSPLTPLGRQGARGGQHDERARPRSQTPSPTRSASTTSSCRPRRSASGSCCEALAPAARAPALAGRGVALLAEHGDDAKVLAGGQSLVPLLNFRLAAPAVLVDLDQRAGAGQGRGRRRSRACGCAVRAARAGAPRRRRSPPVRCWRLALPYVGHVATRNRGTVGGSIAHADAAAELPLVLTALGGEVEVTAAVGRAALVAAEDFFVSHLTSCLEPDELVTEVRFPVPAPGWGAGFAGGRAAPRRLRGLRRRLRAARRGRRRRGGAARRRRGGRPAAAAARGRRGCPGGHALRARRALAAAAEAARAAVEPSDGCTPRPSTAGTWRACW